MSYTEGGDANGIPTRAIHEAYLDMHRALKECRQAKDRGSSPAQEQAHGEVQDTVLTLFGMLRPHLRSNKSVEKYWKGQPPNYPSGNGTAPEPDDGTAVLSWQIHPDVRELNGTSPDEIHSLKRWHEELELADNVRIQSLQPNGTQIFVRYQTYELGLQKLDSWSTQFTTIQTNIGGFFSGKKKSQTVRKRVPVDKLRRAAWALGDTANTLGFLSETDVPVNTDPTPI